MTIVEKIKELQALITDLGISLEVLQEIEKTQYSMQFIEMRKNIEKAIAWGDARIEELKKLQEGSKFFKGETYDNKH
jgi:hypothetical protein